MIIKIYLKQQVSITKNILELDGTASEYIGEELNFKIVDNTSNPFGHINVDDFNVLTEAKSLSVSNLPTTMTVGESSNFLVTSIDAINTNDVTQSTKVTISNPEVLTLNNGILKAVGTGNCSVEFLYGNIKKSI